MRQHSLDDPDLRKYRRLLTGLTRNIVMRKPAISQLIAKMPFWVVLVPIFVLSLFLAWWLNGGEFGIGIFILAWPISIVIAAVIQPRKMIQRLRSTDKGSAFLLYLVILLLTLPVPAGQIYRGEEPLWIWTACVEELQRHGLGAAVFTFCLYALLYSPPFLIPYAALSMIDAVDNPAVNVFASAWCGFTFFLFLDSISGAIGVFVRRMPSDVWNGWLLVLWLFITLLAAAAWWAARKKTKEKRRTKEISDREQRL